MLKESGGHYDFEPRSTAKEFKGNRKGSKRSKKEQQPHHKKTSSSSKTKDKVRSDDNVICQSTHVLCYVRIWLLFCVCVRDGVLCICLHMYVCICIYLCM